MLPQSITAVPPSCASIAVVLQEDDDYHGTSEREKCVMAELWMDSTSRKR